MKKDKWIGKIFAIALLVALTVGMLGGLPTLVSQAEASPGTIADVYPLMEPFENYGIGLMGKIAFVHDVYPGNSEIYVMNADGTNQIQLTDSPQNDYYPAWSPDGTKIAFCSHRDGNWEIYAMNADGSNQTRLTNNPADDANPSWSPDGTKIAFNSHRDGDWEIYVMNADGSNQTRLTNNPADDAHPSWSPDGTRITFQSDRDGNREIYVMNVGGGGEERVTCNSACDEEPAWSPDGNRIAFESDRDGNYEIYVMTPDGSNQMRLTTNPAWDYSPTWSPDSTKIAFTSLRDGNREIYAMNADGSGQTRLTENAVWDFSPAWSPISNGAPTPEWRKNIQPGDILYDVDSTKHWEIGSFTLAIGHIGMYVGDLEIDGQVFHGQTIESNGSQGVHHEDIQNWDYRNNVYLLRVDCSEGIKNAAIEFAREQLGESYEWPDFLLVSKNPDPDSTHWYCSELVWAAYFNQGINIEDGPDTGLVLPVEIFMDDDVSVVDFHLEEELLDDLWTLALCPIDLIITNPENYPVSKEMCGIPGSLYIQDDFNGDGSPDDLIYIPVRQIGDYFITVMPESGASPTDTYSLEISAGNISIILADNAQIGDIPSQGYIIRSTETTIEQIISATIDFNPNILNLRSKGTYVTAYIELPEGYDAEQLDVSSIKLNDIVPALAKPTKVGDYDRDGIPDLMVKFDRDAVEDILTVDDEVEITIAGEVGDNAFEGSDIIRVISGSNIARLINWLRWLLSWLSSWRS